jgi:hypothetical protein
MPVFLICLLIIGVFVATDVALFSSVDAVVREGGGLENASALLYVVAALVFVALVSQQQFWLLSHLPLLLLFFALRELDFDKAFTSSGILSLRFYGGDSALLTKLVGGAIALIFVATVLRTVILGTPAAWRAARARAVWPWHAAAAAGLVVATKSIDGIGRKLLDVGIVISDHAVSVAVVVEEVGEAFIPVFALCAIIAHGGAGSRADQER